MSDPQQTPLTCAYCDAPATTVDHIPPQSLLPGVPRGQRPSVPSCKACNVGASDDDEYFRDVVIKYHRVADKPEAQPVIQSMLRGFVNPQKKRYAESTLRSLSDVRAVTPAGIDVGTQPAYRVDATRMVRVTQRYVRGLHFYERSVRISSDQTIRMHLDVERIIQRQDKVAEVFKSARLRVVREKVFWYKWGPSIEYPGASAWFMVFFDAFPVLGIVHPPSNTVAVQPGVATQGS